MNQKALDNILTRTSVRSFSSKEVSKEVIDKVLEAAMAAPSAVNKQPWDFVVVTQKEKLKELAEALPYAKMTAESNFAVIVCGNLKKALPGRHSQYWIQDCSAATMNILLASHALDLGAVWTAVYPDPFRMESVSKILELPEHIVPLNVIPVGYSDNINSTNKSRYKEENVHMEKWN